MMSPVRISLMSRSGSFSEITSKQWWYKDWLNLPKTTCQPVSLGKSSKGAFRSVNIGSNFPQSTVLHRTSYGCVARWYESRRDCWLADELWDVHRVDHDLIYFSLRISSCCLSKLHLAMIYTVQWQFMGLGSFINVHLFRYCRNALELCLRNECFPCYWLEVVMVDSSFGWYSVKHALFFFDMLYRKWHCWRNREKK